MSVSYYQRPSKCYVGMFNWCLLREIFYVKEIAETVKLMGVFLGVGRIA
jgi:hypothetical protein